METLINILLPLAISGLGFLSYKHPSIARQILKPLLYITIGGLLLVLGYESTKTNTYYESLSTTYLDNYKVPEKKLNIDSLYRNVKDIDSIKLIILEDDNYRKKSYEIDKYQYAIKDSIRTSIRILIDNSRDFQDKYFLYSLLTVLIIFLLQGLSILFDRLQKEEDLVNKRGSDDQIE